ncbi:MAG: hypothetical protein PHG65_04695, partial [Kiritimatiellae bacterium]|nr:hypothetical protein [Kiritimatiellia bacterium]
VFFIILCFLMSGSPLFALLWGAWFVVIGRYILHVEEHFKTEMTACVLLCAVSFGLVSTGLIQLPESLRIKTHSIFEKKLTIPVHHNETRPSPLVRQTAEDVATPPAAPTALPPTPVPPTPTPLAFVEFQEPNGTYTVQLPTGFKHNSRPYRNGTKMLLDYGDGLSVVLLASSMNKTWDAAEAMNSKATAIQEGRAGGQLARLQLENAALTPFPSGTGYTLLLSDKQGSPLSMAAMVRVDKEISFSATITSTDSKNSNLFKTILSCLQNNLAIHGQSTKSNHRTHATPTPPAKAHIPTVDTARDRIRIQGVMEQNGARSVLIDGNLYHEGDRIQVRDGNQNFTFLITRIGRNAGQVEMEAVPHPGQADKL